MSLNSMFSADVLRTRLSGVMAFASILTMALATVTTNCADPDLWGHVQYGREVLRDGVLPRTATWTYAAEGAPWVNHENIAEFLLAWTVDTVGPAGLPSGKLLIAALLFSLMIASVRRAGAGWLATTVVTTLVAANVQFHWHFRPQILTYLSLAAVLAVWQLVFADFRCEDVQSLASLKRRIKFLWLLPAILCFWANSHGGFAAGIAILGAYHGQICLQVLRLAGRSELRFCAHLMFITTMAIAATLINPYGIGLWKFMFDALNLPRPEIADWGSLNLFDQEAVRFWGLICVVLIGLAVNRSKVALPQIVIMGLLLWQGVSHCRHLSIFAIVCGFWLPRHLHALVERFHQNVNRLQSHTQQAPSGYAGMSVATLLLVVNIIRLAPRLSDVPVERSEYPVSAMQFLHDHGLHGKVMVTFNWAQYAIGCFAADHGPLGQSRVAVDGRFETCYPREITDIHFDYWFGTADLSQRYRSPKAPAFDPARALNFKNPDLVLLSREQHPSVRVIEQRQADWILLYQDSLAQLWGRRARYADPDSEFYMPEHQRTITESPQIGTVSWPAFPVDEPAGHRFSSLPASRETMAQ